MLAKLKSGWAALQSASAESVALTERLSLLSLQSKLLSESLSSLAQQRLRLEAALASAKAELDSLRSGQQVSFLSADDTWMVIGADGPAAQWRSGICVIADLKHDIELRDLRIKTLERELQAVASDLSQWSSTIAQRRKSEIEALLATPPA